MSDKKNFRKIALERRKETHARNDGMAARLVASQIIMLPELDTLKNVSGYFTIKDELDCLVTLKALHAARFNLSLPKIKGSEKPLEFRKWDMRAPLTDGPFGTKEPSGAVVRPEIILVPLLAFDETGARLGYGGGYYDRTLSALRQEGSDIVAVGMAYENQKLDEVPTESYDQPLDMVVTETTTYRFE